MTCKRAQSARKRKPNAGVSLLEIIIVLGIMSLVVGLVAPRVIDNFGRAKSKAAEIQMANVKGALQLYYIDLGRYPTEAEGLNALLQAPSNTPSWRGPYLDSVEDIQDPWGREYNYRIPGTENPFDLYTFGRDGYSGGTNEDSDIYL